MVLRAATRSRDSWDTNQGERSIREGGKSQEDKKDKRGKRGRKSLEDTIRKSQASRENQT